MNNKGDLYCHGIHGAKVDVVCKQGINLSSLIIPVHAHVSCCERERERERERDYKELQKAGQELTKGRNSASHTR
jgi:hypothetical protein